MGTLIFYSYIATVIAILVANNWVHTSDTHYNKSMEDA